MLAHLLPDSIVTIGDHYSVIEMMLGLISWSVWLGSNPRKIAHVSSDGSLSSQETSPSKKPSIRYGSLRFVAGLMWVALTMQEDEIKITRCFLVNHLRHATESERYAIISYLLPGSAFCAIVSQALDTNFVLELSLGS